MEIDPLIADHLSSKQITQVLHIAREVVSNSDWHAAARNIVLDLVAGNRRISFDVCNDGVSFDPEEFRNEGSGLRKIEAHAEKLSALFKLESRPSKGTRIIIEIPT